MESLLKSLGIKIDIARSNLGTVSAIVKCLLILYFGCSFEQNIE